MININRNNDNRNLNSHDVAIAGIGGYIGYLGLNKASGEIKKAYYNKFLVNQPVMFNNEAKHFKILQSYTEKISTIFDPNSKLAELSRKLKSVGNEKQMLINSAFIIHNSREAKEASQYSHDFLNLAKTAQSKLVGDEKLIADCKNFADNKQLSQNEKDILTKFLKNPTKRTEIFSKEKFLSIKIYKRLSELSLNVVIDPKLRSLASQMSEENNLKAKGVSYIFGDLKQFKDLKQETVLKIKTHAQKKLKELESSTKSDRRKRIEANKIKSKGLEAISSTNELYNKLIKGTNACYSKRKKMAMVPLLSNFKEAIFHELGHAVNYNSSKNATKIITLLNSKFPRFATPAILFSSLILKKSNNSDEKKDPITNVREVLKNNIMTASFVISAPKLVEEGLASTRSAKFLKDKVTPQQLKTMKTNYFKAWGSYGIAAFSTALALKSAVWISDKIQSKKQSS